MGGSDEGEEKPEKRASELMDTEVCIFSTHVGAMWMEVLMSLGTLHWLGKLGVPRSLFGWVYSALEVNRPRSSRPRKFSFRLLNFISHSLGDCQN